MSDFVRMEIAYGATVEVVPRRARKPRSVRVGGIVGVDVPVVSSGDLPTVASGRDAGGPFVRKSFEGSLVSPMASRRDLNYQAGPDLATVRGRLASASDSCYLLFGHEGPWERHATFGEMPMGVERMTADGRPAVEDAVRKAASGLVIVDGKVWIRAAEPVLMLDHYRILQVAERVMAEYRREGRGFAFRLDRIDDFKEFKERAMRPGGLSPYPRAAEGEIVVETCDASVLKFDQAAHNARWAATLALNLGGDMLSWLPAPLARTLADLSETRARLAAGEGTASEVDGTLRRLKESLPSLGKAYGRAVQLKHALDIGHDAIASSPGGLEPPVEPLDEDDAAALSAMAP